MLERRTLYLVHQLTFGEYFSTKPYAEILTEHKARVGKEPSTITFPLDTTETKNRIDKLISALKAAGWDRDSLSDLCEKEINSSHAVWTATDAVGEAGIFVPYFHARDKKAVKDVFQDGFLQDTEGWGKYHAHALFSTRLADYTTPDHARRLRTIGKAKRAKLIRPITRGSTSAISVMALAPGGKRHCCRDGACQFNGDEDFYCSEVIGGGCSLSSDWCLP